MLHLTLLAQHAVETRPKLCNAAIHAKQYCMFLCMFSVLVNVLFSPSIYLSAIISFFLSLFVCFFLVVYYRYNKYAYYCIYKN